LQCCAQQGRVCVCPQAGFRGQVRLRRLHPCLQTFAYPNQFALLYSGSRSARLAILLGLPPLDAFTIRLALRCPFGLDGANEDRDKENDSEAEDRQFS
ncbi:MAG: hypothetical protein ACRENG_27825, partial [bacterium]